VFLRLLFHSQTSACKTIFILLKKNVVEAFVLLACLFVDVRKMFD